MIAFFYFLIFVQSVSSVKGDEDFWRTLNLEPSLLPWHISSQSRLKGLCKRDAGCPVKEELLQKRLCFGLEKDCAWSRSYAVNRTTCFRRSQWSGASNLEEQKLIFWQQGDFGYGSSRLRTMQVLCAPGDDSNDSYLECSDHLRICKARNIFFNLKSFSAKNSQRYRNDLIHAGEVGGNCRRLDRELLSARGDEKSYLQSWGHELAHFESYPEFRVDEHHCDYVFERPTVIIKLDASVNMYHHFCDFVNLYLSQFINGSFSQDIDILWWDTFSGGFQDVTFGDTWKAFSKHKPFELTHFAGKKICFKNALLPLLARQRLGIYYNMPLIDGCQGSGLFHAFSRHVLYRLGISQHGPLLNKVRVTILQRKSIARKIVNVDELLAAAQALDYVEAKVVVYDQHIPFLEQIQITHDSDIFIGMHGAGLTHLLFLPDWAAVFELYNCDDVNCYLDLARLRGTKYWTWKREDLVYPTGEGKHPTLGTPHKKFTDYSFDVNEFTRILSQMVEYVRRHPDFVAEQRKLRRKAKGEL